MWMIKCERFLEQKIAQRRFYSLKLNSLKFFSHKIAQNNGNFNYDGRVCRFYEFDSKRKEKRMKSFCHCTHEMTEVLRCTAIKRDCIKMYQVLDHRARSCRGSESQFMQQSIYLKFLQLAKYIHFSLQATDVKDVANLFFDPPKG